MTLILRKMNAQARLDDLQTASGWSDDDYAVCDDVKVGRIYKERTPAGEWMWFFQLRPAPPPTQGITQTLDQAKAKVAEAYKRYREAKVGR